MSADNPKKPTFKLKDIYTPELLRSFAESVQEHWLEFPVEDFQRQVFHQNWEALELKERMRHISDCLRRVLPAKYAAATDILVRTVQGLIQQQGEKLAFEYGFIPDFVERFGVEHPDISIPALEQITRWTSAEFAVRPYLMYYPERMYTQMLTWSTNAGPYVRRLSSEGFRPRLPWGMGIPALKKEPAPILPVLENLKADPAETVRRSVANNLNDISKDHPDLVLQIVGKWQGRHPDTEWIIRHACRGLLKKGHPEALKLFGFDPKLSLVTIADFQRDASVRVGERLHFSFTVRNTDQKAAMVRLEYVIDYQTLSGKISRKVFKISEFDLDAGAEKDFRKNQRFQDFTTRKHYPGRHRIGILVNGQEMAAGTFEVMQPI